jgi:flagellar biosynthesis protein FliR
MQIPLFSLEMVEGFILVFVRVSAIIALVPVFGDAMVPAMVKAGLSFLIAVIFFPLVKAVLPIAQNFDPLRFALLIVGEIFIGALIGFTARLVFAGIQIAGEALGFEMGFMFAGVIDPLSNIQVTVISEFLYLSAILLFMVVNAHHLFLSAITDSYGVLPPLGVRFSGSLAQLLLRLSGEVFVIAIKISAPVLAVLIFLNIGMGIIARTVPQMNIFAINFPLQIGVGLLFLGLFVPVFVKLSTNLFFALNGQIKMLLKLASLPM